MTTDKEMTMDLEAALLDQKVAGVFAGLEYAYVAIAIGYGLGIAVLNEPGYNPIAGKTFANYGKAYAYAKMMNKHIGLDADAATRIVCSTMRGPRP